jgi:phosphoglycolate phosphatase-like HAD superfamily hydrolase
LSCLTINIASVSSNIFSPALAQIDNPSLGNVSTSQSNFTSIGQVLSSWTEGAVKETIMNFVKNAIATGNPNYIPPEERIAVFDNDGTLWAEKPTYFQAFFMLNRLQELSKTNPEIQQEAQKNPEIMKLLQNNFTDLNLSEKDIMYVAMTTDANITQPAFNIIVEKWAETAQHPQTHRKFVEMVYQPMIELINFLKVNGFKLFIVSGGGVDFMREALSGVYGIPPEQIIGSSLKYQYLNGTNAENSTIFREPELNSDNNNEVKPENIQLQIGRIPVLAVGNSDGDLQMLTYTDDNYKEGKSLEILIHHDDCVREYCYDKGAENVLQRASERNWTIVNMANDFEQIYPSEGK